MGKRNPVFDDTTSPLVPLPANSLYEPSMAQLSRRATSVISDFVPVQMSTESVSVVSCEPPSRRFAWMEYTVGDITSIAVPEILPVSESRTRPAGSAGVTVKS